ncbi:oxygen-dependent coproporphyrinogen oxidase, partial [Gammaproteobacteria bacterium]|nr:oxygen-dependent coproporphyrinogen oxidase [Gammaproteobacteria bacterium]
KQGGGGLSITINGDVIEKAAVNYSSISGNKLPAASLAKNLKSKQSSKFHAVGVSVISHPNNPFCPTSHMNIRIFLEVKRDGTIINWWIGGGFDLTPFIPSKKDAAFWHQQAKETLDRFNKSYYRRFAKNCDEYFFLPHRNENRGIGGIFFDQLQHKDINTSLNLLEKTSESYINAYEKIILEHRNTKFSNDEKDFQLYRRGRYVEFNLLFDRGTKFGIESNGRAESILASLPPYVSWPPIKSSSLKTKEKKLIKFINKSWSERL